MFFDRHFAMGAFVAILCSVASCASNAQVTVQRDGFSPAVQLQAPVARQHLLSERVWYDTNLSAAYRKDTPASVNYAVRVTVAYYGDWRRYDSAWSDRATELSVRRLNHRVVGCSGRGRECMLQEDLLVQVPAEAVARAAKGEQAQVKVASRTGHHFVYTVQQADAQALQNALVVQQQFAE